MQLAGVASLPHRGLQGSSQHPQHREPPRRGRGSTAAPSSRLNQGCSAKVVAPASLHGNMERFCRGIWLCRQSKGSSGDPASSYTGHVPLPPMWDPALAVRGSQSGLGLTEWSGAHRPTSCTILIQQQSPGRGSLPSPPAFWAAITSSSLGTGTSVLTW